VLVMLMVPVNVAADATADLHALFDEEWDFRMHEFPVFATDNGDHRFNDRLESVSVEDEGRRARRSQEFLDRLRRIDREALSPADRINYDIFDRLLRDLLGEFEHRTYFLTITNRSGFHVSFARLPDRVPLGTVQDYENYIARLKAFHRYARQHIEIMREGIAEGYVLPRVVLEGYEDAITTHIVDDPTRSLLYAPFEAYPEGVSESDRDALTSRGRDAIGTSVVPGYSEFLQFMRDEYIPATRETIAARDLPGGEAFYEHRVLRYTTLETTPEEVHKRGESEVARIRAEMDVVIEEAGFEGTFAEFVEFLRTDDRFYVSSGEQLMKETAFVLKKMDGQLPSLFKTLPRMPYGIKPVPDFIAPKTTTAYYNRPAGDGTRAGYYYVNCYDLPSRPLYEVEALSLHEAVPGHHLQIALMQELEDVPMFRRFSGFTAFVEGWALYSERLGLETGFYQDPYSNFGRLTYEMWRALRLVVDTGMHYFGWTRQQAIDFMVANSALTVHNITTEVDRYIAWPGQAIAYKTGELKIRELRARAESELGEDFDVREFHDTVLLSGAVPLDVLEANVDAWIAAIAATREQ
jgi:uncharacterized protein (DUF885 family)